MFTTKHYRKVAEILRGQYQAHGSINLPEYRMANRTVEEIALDFCREFAKDNPRFDAVTFLNAVSPDPERFPLAELLDEDKNV